LPTCEVKLDTEETPRQKSSLPDFQLSSEIRRLLGYLDQLKDETIAEIEVQITPDRAEQIFGWMEARRRIIETQELVNRVRALEQFRVLTP